MKRFLPAVFGLLAAFAAHAESPPIAISGGTLVNPDETKPLVNAVIIVRNARIVSVGPAASVEIPKDAEIIDARGKWIVPGLIDSHVHFFQSGGLYTRPDAIDLRAVVPYEQEIAAIKAGLDDTFARYLISGITSAVDVGGPMWNFDVRERAGTSALAPRVAVAGPLFSTYKPAVISDVRDPPIIKADSAAQARKLVRQQADKQPDLIKIWYIVLAGQTPAMFLPVVKETIEESHERGIRVAVHATELETARAAVKAGADILVHSVMDKEVDTDFVELLKEKDVIYTPTLAVMNGYRRTFSQQHEYTPQEFELANPHVMSTLFDLRHLPAKHIPQLIRERIDDPPAIAPQAVSLKNLRTLHAAGVTIAAGTDAGNIGTLHGPSIFREFGLMADAGLAPADILLAATLNGARLMGHEGELGSVKAGKLADMVVLNSDPLLDIQNTSDIHLVIKNGTVFRPDELIRQSPADVVQQQVNAYNARDLEAFLATYRNDVEILEYPDNKLLMSGLEAMRREYRELFAGAPTLHCRIVNRIEIGDFVIDREQITGGAGGKMIDAVAIYEVRNGLIRRVWFIAGQ